MDGWNTTFLLGRPIFRGHVSFRECRLKNFRDVEMLDRTVAARFELEKSENEKMFQMDIFTWWTNSL